MKKLDKLGRVFNIVLGIIYVPLSLFGWLMQMTSESAMDATNPLYITLIEIFCIISFIIPFLCAGCIIASVILRKKERSIGAFIVQFIPLFVFVLNMIFLCFIESVPAMLQTNKHNKKRRLERAFSLFLVQYYFLFVRTLSCLREVNVSKVLNAVES